VYDRIKRCSSSIILIVLVFVTANLSYGKTDNRTMQGIVLPFNEGVRFHPSLLINQEESNIGEIKLHRPSKAKAFFFSFVLPGAGEYYAGSKKMARIFFCSEILLWTTFLAFRTYGDWKKDDYRQFAVSRAGVNPNGKEHQYFVDIENYMNIREYNDAKLRQRDVGALYPENAFYNWEWDSEELRKRYEKLRISSDHAYARSLFVVGGIILNHIVSGIDALRVAKKNQEARRLRVGVAGLPEGGMMIVVWKHF
jgi:hypothetical protein